MLIGDDHGNLLSWLTVIFDRLITSNREIKRVMQICMNGFDFHAKSSQYTLKSLLGVNHMYYLLANSDDCMLKKCSVNLYQVEIQTLLWKVLHLVSHN